MHLSALRHEIKPSVVEDTLAEVPLERGVVPHVAVLLVGAVDDSHTVHEEVGDVQDTALPESLVVAAGVFELVVGGPAHDAGRDGGDRRGAQHASGKSAKHTL